MIRKILSVIAGVILFYLLVGLSMAIFAKFELSPMGRFIQLAFSEKTPEESVKFVTSDEGYDLMHRGITMMGLVVLPLISVGVGFLIGWISKTRGGLCGVVVVGPSAAFLMGFSSLISMLSILMCTVLAATAGYTANALLFSKE